MRGLAKMEASLWAVMSLMRVEDVRGRLRDARMWVVDSSSLCLSKAGAMLGRTYSLSEASVIVRLRLLLARVVSAVNSCPRTVSRRRRLDLRLPSLSVVPVGGIEGEESRAGVAGGSGLIFVRLAADVGGSRESSSAPEKADALRVRVGNLEEAVLGARAARPLVEMPRGGRPLRGFAVGGGSVGGGRFLVAAGPGSFFVLEPAPRIPEASNLGDRPPSLMGLTSSARGRIGDLGDPSPPGKSVFFHFVVDAGVLIGDGFGGLLFPSEAVTGVCWLRGLSGGYGEYGDPTDPCGVYGEALL